ncbi:MAG: SHOCT domain-containing protein [Bacilli bacterium]|nr:SHOCT domain-containing protein [Bacilli bacterium]
MQAKKIIRAIAFLIIIVLCFVQFIKEISNIKDINNVLESIKYYSFYTATTLNDIAKMSKVMAIIDLVGQIVSSIVGVVGLIFTFKEEEMKSSRFFAGVFAETAFFTFVINLYGIIKSKIILKEAYDIPTSAIIIVIVALIGVILFSCSNRKEDKAKKNLFTASIVATIACFIICLTEDHTEFLTYYYIFIAIAGVVGIITYYLPEYASATTTKGNISSIPASNYNPDNQVSKPDPIIVETKPQVNDASEQLIKLKNLYDNGVISKEEYEEKRKKYIDLL